MTTPAPTDGGKAHVLLGGLAADIGYAVSSPHQCALSRLLREGVHVITVPSESFSVATSNAVQLRPRPVQSSVARLSLALED